MIRAHRTAPDAPNHRVLRPAFTPPQRFDDAGAAIAQVRGYKGQLYLKDVPERLPTQPASRIAELLPHRWRSTPLH